MSACLRISVWGVFTHPKPTVLNHICSHTLLQSPDCLSLEVGDVSSYSWLVDKWARIEKGATVEFAGNGWTVENEFKDKKKKKYSMKYTDPSYCRHYFFFLTFGFTSALCASEVWSSLCLEEQQYYKQEWPTDQFYHILCTLPPLRWWQACLQAWSGQWPHHHRWAINPI